MQKWIWPVTPENWKVVLSKNIWAVKIKSKTTKVSKDDLIIFYVKGTGSFKGIFKVTSDWYESTTKEWEDEINQNKIIYPFQCKLEPIIIGDAVFNELIPTLSITKDKTVPQVVLRGTVAGPANNAQPIPESDFSLIQEKMKEPSKPIVAPKENQTEHEDIIEKLADIGSALGFDPHSDQEYTLVAKGSKVDLVWETKVANIGTFWYVFEVQSKGSIKSLIQNLIQSINNPTVKKIIAVSDKQQLEKIKEEVNQMMALTNSSKAMFVYLDVEHVKNFSKILPEFNSFKEKLHLS